MASTSRALLGHCRAATRGESSRFNAHPFCFDNIVGTHNGTLSYQSHKKLTGEAKFQTDSEAIFAEIEAFGIGPTVKKFKGYKENDTFSCPDAYALVWYDTRENSINFLRNKERPLYFAFDKKREQLFWSSEMAHLIAGMSDTPHEDSKWVHCLPENDHYSWVIPEFGKAFGKPRVVKREGDKSSSFTHSTPIGQKNTPTYGGKSDNNSASRFSWLNGRTGFYEKFVCVGGSYIYSKDEHGTYYDTEQEAWDHLSEGEKIRRLNIRLYPAGIETGYVWSDEMKHFVKLGKPELKLVSDNTRATSTLYDEVKEKKLTEATLSDSKAYVVHKEQNKRVYYSTEHNRYIVYSFEGMHNDLPWQRSEVMTCPDFVPFTSLDVNANHSFKHIGRGRKKVIYFKGFKNEMLVRQSFDKIMKCGCVNCKRTPEWGNPVHFLDKTMFLCEHCARNPDQVREWKQAIEDQSGQDQLVSSSVGE
jgi:hypothetical protein